MNSLGHHHGFSLIELVMVIVILGVLSATALPRFFNVSVYQEQAFFNDTLSAIRYAQKLAIATNCNVQVYITGNQYALKKPGATDRSQCQTLNTVDFTQAVLHPATGVAYTGSQAGVNLSSAAIVFNALGAANSDFNLTVGSSRQISIVKDTGFAYDNSP